MMIGAKRRDISVGHKDAENQWLNELFQMMNRRGAPKSHALLEVPARGEQHPTQAADTSFRRLPDLKPEVERKWWAVLDSNQ